MQTLCEIDKCEKMEELDLSTVWEWDTTGNPCIQPDKASNVRFCPTVEDMTEVVRSLHIKSPIANDVKENLRRFMTSNDPRMTINFDAHESAVLKKYLRFIRSLDFKKIRLDYKVGGTLHMSKLRRDTPFNGQPDGEVNQIRNGRNDSVHGMVDDINHNALLGWHGPGTFPCWYPRCGLCRFVGRSDVVRLGPNGVLPLTKRAYCYTKNSVYVGVCRQCEDDGTFVCYFGETSRSLNQRCDEHKCKSCNLRSPLQQTLRFPTVDHRRAEVARVIAEGVDPDNILQDWFAHICDGGLHAGHQMMSVVYIKPHAFVRKNRERLLVEKHGFHNANNGYLGMGRGFLNMYTDF